MGNYVCGFRILYHSGGGSISTATGSMHRIWYHVIFINLVIVSLLICRKIHIFSFIFHHCWIWKRSSVLTVCPIVLLRWSMIISEACPYMSMYCRWDRCSPTVGYWQQCWQWWWNHGNQIVFTIAVHVLVGTLCQITTYCILYHHLIISSCSKKYCQSPG